MEHVKKFVQPSDTDCCGCSACEAVCPNQAITLQPDALGFLYPRVNENLCVNCGLCSKVCSFNNHYDVSLNLSEPLAYGARHKSIKEVETSRSGAAFVAISDYILDMGGVVYGVGYEDHFRVVHKRATTRRERDEFKGSKYVQSDLKDSFRRVKEDLEQGRLVLFSGTACQCAGLNSYIGKKLRERLVLVDIVCHGVPSPYVWRDYLLEMEKVHCSRIVSVNFRDKAKYGWKAHKESYDFESGEKVYSDRFTSLFYHHIMLRKSCSICYYTNLKRPSDLTLADFWGWEKTNSVMNADDKGISLVLVNSARGEEIFKSISSVLNLVRADLPNIMQRNFCCPTNFDARRNSFEVDYAKKGFQIIQRKYAFKEGLIGKIKRRIKKIWGGWKLA